MAIAAIDFGKRRIGIASCDTRGIVAYPVAVIQRRSIERDVAELGARLQELDATRVIVGLPLNMDGSAGPAAREAERFATHLRNATGLKVELYDERLSTFEAEQRLKAASKRRRHASVDAVAALVILESWLAAQRNEI